MKMHHGTDFFLEEFHRLCPPTIQKHSLAVAQRCQEESGRLSEEILWCAGLLHDIGKSPDLQNTGFHPLDGALYLQSLGENDLASLVARHSGAPEEARLLRISLRPWDTPKYPRYQKVLDTVDLTTSPEGKKISFQERLADIQRRYGEQSTEFLAVSSLTQQQKHQETTAAQSLSQLKRKQTRRFPK